MILFQVWQAWVLLSEIQLWRIPVSSWSYVSKARDAEQVEALACSEGFCLAKRMDQVMDGVEHWLSLDGKIARW